MHPLVSLKNVWKLFPGKPVLRDLSLDIYQGEILGLVGRSGCGKSTLIKTLVGYHIPDAGHIYLEGRDATKDPMRIRRLVGYTTQDNSFYDRLTVRENMEYFAHLYRLPRAERPKRIEQVLDEVQLSEAKDRLAGSLSGGMKRRLDFAISIVHHPKLVVLDEPTTGLDPSLVKLFWEIVQTTVHEEELAVLVSSHILADVQAHCTRAAIMAEGMVKQVVKIDKRTRLESLFHRVTA